LRQLAGEAGVQREGEERGNEEGSWGFEWCRGW